MTLRFIWYSGLEQDEFPHPSYEQLLARLPQVTPFNRLAWLRSCAAHKGNKQLQVLTAWQGERMVLCLPLIRQLETHLGLRWQVVRHLGYPLADRIALAVEPTEQCLGRKTLREIRQRLPHSLLELSEVIPTAGSRMVALDWARRSSFCSERLSCQVPEHRVSESDREEPAGDLRYELRRARKRVAETGAVIRRWIPDQQSAKALLSDLASVERASWKGEAGVGVFSTSNWPLMESALIAMAGEGRVRIITIELDGRCISYRLGLLEHGRLYDYSIGFLPEYARLGSGRLLLNEWLMWGLDEGWQWIDASRVSLRNSTHQLHERMDGLVEHRQWRFYSFRPGGALLGTAYRFWGWIKPLMGKNISEASTRDCQRR